jgi:DNA-binding NtrC family response regulator
MVWDCNGGFRLQRPKLPVTFITGHHEDDMERLAIAQEAAFFLRKPFDAGELLRATTLAWANLPGQRTNSITQKARLMALAGLIGSSKRFRGPSWDLITSAIPATGRFQGVHGGTLFLDEIGDFLLELQPKPLCVLQEQQYERLGSSRTLRVDVRVIAATNQDLFRMVEGNIFREDIYYRLSVFPISLPLLRERRAISRR